LYHCIIILVSFRGHWQIHGSQNAGYANSSSTGHRSAASVYAQNRTDAIAGPLVLETLFKHFLNPSQASRGIKHKEAREDDLMYDEGQYSQSSAWTDS
jgi:hypothetical protein